MIRYGIPLIVTIPLILIFNPVSALQTPASAPHQYGIILSQTCLTLLKNHLPTDCPSYEQLLTVFPDNTIPEVSGGFSVIDGVWQRETPPMDNPDRYYWYKTEPILWLDPPGKILSKIHLITIEASLPEYKTKDSIKMDDYNISFGKDRYVDVSCTNARITAKNWLFLTGDSMQLLKHKCDPKFTNFNSTKIITFEKSYQDITTSYKYHLDQWIKESKIKCKEKCNEY